MKRIQVLDVPVDCIDQDEALKTIEGFLADRQRHQLVFLNRPKLFRARRDAEFRRCLREASLILPVSPAVVRAAGFLKREPLHLIAPFTFVIRLLALAERLNRSVYLLGSRKEEVEQTFGDSLSWEPLENKRACRIKHIIEQGGYRSPESQWPEIQAEMVNKMMLLEKALKPALDSLNM